MRDSVPQCSRSDKMEVEFRDTVPEDYAEIARILDDQWLFSLYSKTNGPVASEYYLLQCMNDANVAETIFVDGKQVGAVAVGRMGGKSLDVHEDLERLEAQLKRSDGYDAMMRDMKLFDDVFEGFVSKYMDDGLAELTLLIIDKGCRGMGIGRKAIEEALRIVSDHGKKGLFFYTDTDCNFGFYDRMGAKRLDHVKTECLSGPIDIFAYRLDVGSPN